MSADEKHGVDGDAVMARDLGDLRREFLKSSEFHNAHLETLFENLVPQSIAILYETKLGFKIYLDLRQLHISFGVLNNNYDSAEVDLIRKIMPSDGVFFDVGANCGYYSLAVAAKKDFCGKVVAFEPLPPLSHLLERSVAANGWSKKIELRRIALGHEPGTLPLTDAEFGINAGATRLAIGLSHQTTHRSATVDTLDNAARDLSPDVVKVDIEGAEGLFFHGARETLKRDKPSLLFELNPELLKIVSHVTPGDLQNWLDQLHYKLWSVEPNGLAPVTTKQNVGELIGDRGMKNFVAIHTDRLAGLREQVEDGSIPDHPGA